MKNGWKMVSSVALGVMVWCGFGLLLFAASPAPANNAALAFEKLKSLAGRWEATTEQGKLVTTYEVVSNGTALLERMEGHGAGGMVTVYHLEGDHLVLTHYCAAGNQPHMQAQALDPTPGEIHFQLAGVQGLGSSEAGHMDEVVIRFQGPDQVSEDWTWRENGTIGHVVALQYRRVQ